MRTVGTGILLFETLHLLSELLQQTALELQTAVFRSADERELVRRLMRKFDRDMHATKGHVASASNARETIEFQLLLPNQELWDAGIQEVYCVVDSLFHGIGYQ